MSIAKLSSKGQITIPLDVRRRLGLQAGDRVEFIEDQLGFRLQKRVAGSPLEAYRGYLAHLAGHDPDELLDELRGR